MERMVSLFQIPEEHRASQDARRQQDHFLADLLRRLKVSLQHQGMEKRPGAGFQALVGQAKEAGQGCQGDQQHAPGLPGECVEVDVEVGGPGAGGGGHDKGRSDGDLVGGEVEVKGPEWRERRRILGN